MTSLPKVLQNIFDSLSEEALASGLCLSITDLNTCLIAASCISRQGRQLFD